MSKLEGIDDAITGLRRLADFVEQNKNIFHEDICDFDRNGLELSTCLLKDHEAQDQMTVVRSAIAELPLDHEVLEEKSDFFSTISVDFGGGIKFELNASISQVCEKVVVGTKSEYVEEAVAWERKIVEVPIEEWRCI